MKVKKQVSFVNVDLYGYGIDGGAKVNFKEGYNKIVRLVASGKGIVHPDNQAHFALCYLFGWGVEKSLDNPNAHRKASAACKKGNGFGLFYKGMQLLHAGRACRQAQKKKYYNEAEKCFKAACKYFKRKDSPSAWVYLGICYEEGRGVIKNKKLAKKYYKASAKFNNAFAKNRLGILYLKLKQYKKAIYWFEQAELQDYPDACAQLAELYRDGTGVEKNDYLSMEKFKQAASSGHALALREKSLLNFNDKSVQAIDELTSAAIQEDAAAQYKLGCYFKDQGKDNQAALWYKAAARQGHNDAQFNLAWCYDFGKGRQKNPVKAQFWYEKAAEKGHCYAQFAVAWYFEHAGNDASAYHYYTLASESNEKHNYGFFEPVYRLGLYYERKSQSITKRLFPAQRRKLREKALELYRQAAEGDLLDGMRDLARCKLQDANGRIDYYLEAVSWLRRATEKGHMPSFDMLRHCVGILKTMEFANSGEFLELKKWVRVIERRVDRKYQDSTSVVDESVTINGLSENTKHDVSDCTKSLNTINATMPLARLDASGAVKNLYRISREALHFNDQKPIAIGGFGLIFKGKWQRTTVAIKKLNIDKMKLKLQETNLTVSEKDTTLKHLIDDFGQEVERMDSFHHPNIIRTFGACLYMNTVVVVMQYMKNGSLHDWFSSHMSLSLRQKYQINIDIGNGLRYLHEQGIIHRDLKAANILLTDNYNAVITDFGVSVSTANIVKGGGTTRWNSPELFGGFCSVRSDIYSYGLLIGSTFNKSPPYPTVPEEAVQNVITNGIKPRISPGLPQSIKEVIKFCWMNEPKNRPASVEEVMAPLETEQSKLM